VASILNFRSFEPQPMFDRRAIPIYLLLAAGFGVSFILARITGVVFSIPGLVDSTLKWALLFVAGLCARRIGWTRLGNTLEGIAILYGMVGLGGATYPLTVISAPLADSALARTDQLLGFDFLGYVRALNTRFILQTLTYAYGSFEWQLLAVIAALFFTSRADRAWRFIMAGWLALFFSLMIYPLAPAVGAFHHFGLTPGEFAIRLRPSPWGFGDAIVAIKSGTRVVTPDMLSGLVSFPSYHTAAAVLYAWAMWPFRGLRWIFIVINAAMIAACPIFGGHYFVDLIAGAAVGIAAIVAAGFISGRWPALSRNLAKSTADTDPRRPQSA
jgi:membrane-associated phospholipid phosphatase